MRSASFTNPHFEFHIAQERREFYQLDEPLFAQSGNVIFSNFYMVRLFAEKMNRKRDAALYPEHAVKAGQLNAMGLIDEILHYVVELYLEQRSNTAFAEALKWIELKLGKQDLQNTLQRFVTLFPPMVVYKGTKSVESYLKGKTAGISNREITLIELLIALAVIATLTNVAVPVYSEYVERANVMQAIADINSIDAQMAAYESINNGDWHLRTWSLLEHSVCPQVIKNP